MSEIQYKESDLSYLLSPRAIREKAQSIFLLAEEGKTHFSLRLDRLDEVADFVLAVTRENYPDLKIPFHSRWGHFQAGKIDRLNELNQKFSTLSKEERARSKFDLVITSVLLDAGAGTDWKYQETGTGCTLGRSEGLAIASFRMFLNGAFSSESTKPWQADAQGLLHLSLKKLADGFQVSDSNPLVGTEGRCSLLQQLGKTIQSDPIHFPANGTQSPRPGNLIDFFLTRAKEKNLPATEILSAVLQSLGPIWPGRIQLGTTHLGDVWQYPLLGNSSSVNSLVPFHKLSQWLTYSLIEPLEELGLNITDIEELTGLAEYRNGGLVLDRGLIELRDPQLVEKFHRPDSPLVIEWRALTLVLLEKIAEKVRDKLGKSPKEMPLAKVLEGGTWWAGRRAASALRANGAPPLKILSDGTVF